LKSVKPGVDAIYFQFIVKPFTGKIAAEPLIEGAGLDSIMSAPVGSRFAIRHATSASAHDVRKAFDRARDRLARPMARRIGDSCLATRSSAR
jgi:hypothetical protein